MAPGRRRKPGHQVPAKTPGYRRCIIHNIMYNTIIGWSHRTWSKGTDTGLSGASVSKMEIRQGRASVGISPENGGSLAWFRWEGRGRDRTIDWLRPAPSEARPAPDAGAMACFPLVPYSNRIRGGRFAYGGRQVRLPVAAADPNFEHGHGWRRPWTTEHLERSRAVLRYRHEVDAWPWSYEAEQEIALDDDALIVRLTLRNLSAEPMPAGLGLHPHFPASPAARIETAVGGMWETDADVLPVRHADLPGGQRTIEVAAAELDNVFTGWSRHARIVWPERGLSLDIEAEAPLDFLVLYTPQAESFFCCEPVSNATDAFNLASQGVRGTGLLVLEPGAARAAAVRFVPRAAETSQP